MNSIFSDPTKRLYLIVGVALVGGFLQYQFNVVPIHASREAVVPLAVELTHSVTAKLGKTDKLELPTATLSKTPGTYIRVQMYAWTAQLGLDFANGGVKTTANSLMEKNGVKAQLIVQSDLNKSQIEQIKFAESFAEGDASKGAHFVIMMGDGSAQYLAGINKVLEKLGPDYKAEIVGAVGYSGNEVSGEDACMGPPEWTDNPDLAKGALIAGYLRDGDWNLCLDWMTKNGLKNNPDETSYDPDAVNWLSTDDHLKAAEAYIIGTCEDRKVVRGGKFTSEPRKHVCVAGVATWTPGDVNIAKKKGGLVKLISTKENSSQMPAVVIGIHKWNTDNAKKVQSFLKASFEGADQIRSYPDALARAGKAAFDVYGEESPAYWVRYYTGTQERDRTGKLVSLGGSRAIGLGDNLVLFGLAEGVGNGLENSIWRASYEGFGKVAQQQYPKLVPSFPNVIEATNTSFLQALSETSGLSKVVEVPQFESTGAIVEKLGETNYDIPFDTGRATFSPAARVVLDTLYNQLVIGRLSVDIGGHTDNTGNPAGNVVLSEARAKAVEDYLRDRAPKLFNGGRVTSHGEGDRKPVAPNTTPEGRAKNRRVTVILGNK